MLNQFDLQNRDLFEGIQGNILKAHGRHHTANVFIKCDEGKQPDAKAWLKSLAEGEEAIIHSAYVQLRNNALFKESAGKVDTGLFAAIHISAVGYDYLLGEDARLQFADPSFQKGMKNADLDAGPDDFKLNDPDPATWEVGLREDTHFMLLLAHANPEELSKLVVEVLNKVESFTTITTIERGEALLNKEGAGIEHFGYVDGISQPLFFEDEWETYKTNNNIKDSNDIKFDPRAEKELVLIPDPFAPGDPNALGSYFVFRKLEQDVSGFKNAEEELARQLGLVGEAEERAGALLVGRFEDGTPVELSDKEGLINSALLNNFDYSFADASRCPFHAHIRKTNPRSGMPPGTGSIQEAKSHVMARRGITFGTRSEDLSDRPSAGVGLLFMSYQASIVRQFEFIQKLWANNPAFPHINAKTPNGLDGLDPIIGQGQPRVAGAYPTEWENPLTQTRADFGQFVHLKGGEYFFAPSMGFLKNL